MDLIYDTWVGFLPIIDPCEMGLEAIANHPLVIGSFDENTSMPFTKGKLNLTSVSIDR